MPMLSDHVSVAEFERSATALRHGIPNVMKPHHKSNAERLCRRALDPIRKHYKSPIIITSGYRGPILNRLVRGSSNSQHCLGEAGDFYIVGVPVTQVFNDVKSGKIEIEYDQLIHEGTWIHLSYRQGRNRRQNLRADFTKNGVRYYPA